MGRSQPDVNLSALRMGTLSLHILNPDLLRSSRLCVTLPSQPLQSSLGMAVTPWPPSVLSTHHFQLTAAGKVMSFGLMSLTLP